MSPKLPGCEFTAAPSYEILRELAVDPPDLTDDSVLTPERIGAYCCEAAGWRLLYGTQRVDEPVLAALQDLARETAASERFGAMISGERLNRIEGWESENRQVLHTVSRNVFDDLPDTHGHRAPAQAAATARAGLEQLQRFLTRLDGGDLVGRGGPFTDLVHVGIGGSDLGPRALYLALQPFRVAGRRVHFISNVDPDDAAQVLSGLDLSRTLINVVSKSGGTLETRTNESLVRQAFDSAGLDPVRHTVCVTGPGSPMDDSTRYREVFHMHDYIGGRYSATSMVGALPLGFALGHGQLLEFLRGAREMDLAACAPLARENPALCAALLGIWNRNFLGLPTLAVLPYSQALSRFPGHLQQLDMESHGKAITRAGAVAEFDTGPIVWGEPGTNGQHAFYQLIHQSRTVVPCEFIGLRQSQTGLDMTVDGSTSQQKLLANLLAQSIALAAGRGNENPNRVFPGNRPNSVLMAERLTPRTLGALLAFYEAKVVYQGLIWNVNSFDQEGVQLGKQLAGRMLDRLREGQAAAETDPLAQAMLAAAGLQRS